MNIVKKDNLYYHPALREKSSLSAVESFTERDVVEYFYERAGMTEYGINFDRDCGAIRYLLAKNGDNIDLLMYSIDRMINICYGADLPIPDIINADRYYSEGHKVLGEVRELWSSYGLTTGFPTASM